MRAKIVSWFHNVLAQLHVEFDIHLHLFNHSLELVVIAPLTGRTLHAHPDFTPHLPH